MSRRTEGSSKEEQIIQKEQILAELQRVEKELQEKAQAQLLMSGELQPAVRSSTKREAGEGQRGVCEGQEEIQAPAPFNFTLDQQGPNLATTEVRGELRWLVFHITACEYRLSFKISAVEMYEFKFFSQWKAKNSEGKLSPPVIDKYFLLTVPHKKRKIDVLPI